MRIVADRSLLEERSCEAPGAARRSAESGASSSRSSGSVLSRESLDAALRLARAQDATLVPSYLAVVPLSLSIEAPLGSECEGALALLELIEQRAAGLGSRSTRGSSGAGAPGTGSSG